MAVIKHRPISKPFPDSRSGKVIFLSHCILNENTRYLGGAAAPACIQPVVEQCIRNDWGMVQMPCPEQQAWGGVGKRFLLLTYGSKGTFLYLFRGFLLPLFVLYTKWIYRNLARKVVAEIKDYLNTGYTVVSIAGVDGSPSCGVNTGLVLEVALEGIAELNLEELTSERANRVVQESLNPGEGMFTIALKAELSRQKIDIPYVAHDLFAELLGETKELDGFAK